MDDRESGCLLRKSERKFPDQDDGGVDENGKGSVLKFAREIAANPGVRTEQRQISFRPASSNVSENRQDRELVIVVPKEKRIVPEENEAEGDDGEAGEKRTEEIVGRLCQTPVTDVVRSLSAFHRNALQHHRCALGQEQNLVVDAPLPRRGYQTGGRFVERFIAEPKTPVMHGHQSFRLELEKRLNRFLRIHVDLASGWRVVTPDWQKRDLDVVALADFLEAFEVSAVAAMKNRASIHFNDESAKAAVQIGQKPRTPMGARGERNLDRPELDGLPVIQLVDDIESEIVDQIADPDRNDDRLVSRDF